MKFTIDEIQEILASNKIENDKINKVTKDLTEVAKQKKEEAEEEKEPKPRTEYTAIVLDEAGVLPSDLTGFVVCHRADVDPITVVSRLNEAVKAHNSTPRGRKNPIKSLIEAMKHTKRRFLKEQHIQIKTKDLIRVVKSTNKVGI